MPVTDDTDNAQSLSSACVTSNVIFSHLNFDEKHKFE